MFKVVLHWDEFEHIESYYGYEFAVEAFEHFKKISEQYKAEGAINEYRVDLVKEADKC